MILFRLIRSDALAFSALAKQEHDERRRRMGAGESEQSKEAERALRMSRRGERICSFVVFTCTRSKRQTSHTFVQGAGRREQVTRAGNAKDAIKSGVKATKVRVLLCF